MEKNKLIVILGTTACGKSGLGVALAKRYHGEIVSADSRQVYRGLDLGTGKITPEELDDLEDVAALQGIAHVPARVKCAVLAWHTLEEALDGEGKTDKVTTEEES